MNKPATKEPSMDEILSSIRQIIADDDASVAPQPAARPAMAATPLPRPVVPPTPPRAAAPVPLALSAAQIVPPAAPAKLARAPEPVAVPEPAEADFSAMLAGFDEPDPSDPMGILPPDESHLVDPEDIAFEADPEPEPERAPPPVMSMPEPPRPASRAVASVAQAAPMPDLTLSSDMAEELLAPATDAAVQGAMSRLSMMAGTGIGGMTVESMIRDMLRPMLKEWLDENLPSLVESMVEKEIVRISRGVK